MAEPIMQERPPQERQERPPQEMQREEAPKQSPLIQFLETAVRMLIIYYAFNMAKSFFSTKTSTNSPPLAKSDGLSYCAWPTPTYADMYVHLTESPVVPALINDASSLVYKEGHLKFGSDADAWADRRMHSIVFDTPDNVRLRNGTLFAHVFIVKESESSSSASKESSDGKEEAAIERQSREIKFDRKEMIYRRREMVVFKKLRKQNAKRNLISGDIVEPSKNDDVTADVIAPHWVSNLTVNLIQDSTPITLVQLPSLPHLALHMQFADHERTKYLPTVYLNDFWQLQEDLDDRPINETVTQLTLNIEYEPQSMWKFQMMVQMDMSFRMQTETFGVSPTEVDTIKRMLFETNPYFLALTFAVSLLHSLFDFLAFKNDIQFWNNRKHAGGLSMRTIFLNIILQSIIVLYLLDNDTSWMIVASTGVGLAIEIWKIRKVVTFEISRTQQSLYGMIPFKLLIKDKNPPSKLTSETNQYDKLAFRYLGMACFPLVIGYAIYSIIYEPHKNLYSWLLNTLVGFVYTFGFIASTPQLFINYKLKSTAHMPWKSFIFKALNTVVDDLFAFVIKMPTLHRLACFRDDLVFVVYLYQKWIYPTDEKRANEFGQVGEGGGDLGDDVVVKEGEEEDVVAGGGTDEAKKDK